MNNGNDKVNSVERIIAILKNNFLESNRMIVAQLESVEKKSRKVIKADFSTEFIKKGKVTDVYLNINNDKFILKHTSAEMIISSNIEFSPILNFAIGTLKYSDKSSFTGFIDTEKKSPFLVGVYTDSQGQKSVQIDLELEMGINLGVDNSMTDTDKTVKELLDFTIEHINKLHEGENQKIEKDFWSVLIKSVSDTPPLAIKTDITEKTLNWLISKKVKVKCINNNEKFPAEVFITRFKEESMKYSLKSNFFKEILFEIRPYQNNILFENIDLNDLLDYVKFKTVYSTKTTDCIPAENLYPFNIFLKYINAKAVFNHDEIYKKFNLTTEPMLYIDTLQGINKAKFYLQEQDPNNEGMYAFYKLSPQKEITTLSTINLSYEIGSERVSSHELTEANFDELIRKRRTKPYIIVSASLETNDEAFSFSFSFSVNEDVVNNIRQLLFA